MWRWIGLAIAVAPPDGSDAFEDPSPPVVAVLPPAPRPEPTGHPGLTAHRAPRPLSEGAVIEDWPAFLGPRRDAHCRETPLEIESSEGGPPVIWEVERGEGYASPVVADGVCVFTHRVDDQVHVDALDLETGKRFWRRSFPCAYRGEYIRNGGPRSTPVIHGDTVYVHDVEGRLFAFDLNTGRTRWQRDLTREFGVPDSFFGVVSSPVVYGDVLVQNLGAAGGPCVAAFDLETGRLVWGVGREWGASCASPVVATSRGEDRIYVLTGGKSRPPVGGLLVIDPRRRALVTRYPFRSKRYESVNGASPLPFGDGVMITASYGTGSAFLEPDESGEYVERWRERRFGIQFATPVRFGDRILAVEGASGRAGAVVSIRPGDGSVEWRSYIDETVEIGGVKEASLSLGEGSLLVVGETLLAFGDTGLLVALDVGEDGVKTKSRAAWFRITDAWTPPVISRGILLLCQNSTCSVTGKPARLLAADLRGGG